MDDQDKKTLRRSGRFSGIGFEFVGMVVGCLFLGWWLDGKYGTDPWFMVAGLFIGTAGGFVMLMRVAKSLQNEADQERGS